MNIFSTKRLIRECIVFVLAKSGSERVDRSFTRFMFLGEMPVNIRAYFLISVDNYIC